MRFGFSVSQLQSPGRWKLPYSKSPSGVSSQKPARLVAVCDCYQTTRLHLADYTS